MIMIMMIYNDDDDDDEDDGYGWTFKPIEPIRKGTENGLEWYLYSSVSMSNTWAKIYHFFSRNKTPPHNL